MRPIRTLVLLVSFVVVVPIAEQVADAAPIHCSMRDPTSCPNTGFLHWSRGFSAAVKRFAGDNRVSYFQRELPLSAQALDGLGGPPQDRVDLPARRYLFSACPAHDCAGNATAIILDAHGRILALGFSSFCETECDFANRRLDFYLHEPERDESLITALKAWGTGAWIKELHMDPSIDVGIEQRTYVHWLP